MKTATSTTGHPVAGTARRGPMLFGPQHLSGSADGVRSGRAR